MIDMTYFVDLKYNPQSKIRAHSTYSNHVLYVSNVSRLAGPNFYSICAGKQKKVWSI